jgi:hypothetical protein
MINLNFPNPITQPEDFYGRKAELSRIVAALCPGKRLPVIILGERRIGKTSALNMATLRLAQPQAGGYTPLQVERLGVKSFASLAAAILSRLAGVCIKENSAALAAIDGLPAQVGSIAEFEDLFSRLAGACPSQAYLLCIDEADIIFHGAQPEDALQLSAFFHHLVSASELPVRLILTMSSVPDILSRSQATPYTSLADLVELKPFSPGELREMTLGLLQGEAQVDDRFLEWLYEMSGGHPYVAKLLLAHLVAKREPARLEALTPERLAQALKQAARDPNAEHALKNLYTVHLSDPEKRALLLLAKLEAPLSTLRLKDIDPTLLAVAKRLADRGYLREQAGQISFSVLFLAHWLHNWTEFDEELDRLGVNELFLQAQ